MSKSTKKFAVTFLLIGVSLGISAQTEMRELPDTGKLLFDSKPANLLNSNFNSLKNSFPARLTVSHDDIYISINDSIKQDSLKILYGQAVNSDLPFVRSAYFTDKSPLFTETDKRQEIKSGVSLPFFLTQEKLHSLSFVQLKIVGNKLQCVTVSAPLHGGNGIGILTKEERMKKRAKERKKAYVYNHLANPE
ncbi:MAG: hypothetical protein LBP63_00795 [Prevotellaceae bacterium]|jgi:hypothetical protein|nr:hypothetical protein [Prevotellaceae bacterium]